MDKKQIFTNLNLDELRELVQECVNNGLGSITIPTKESSDLIKAKEACEFLQVSKVTLYNWMNENIIPSYYIGSRLYFKKSELVESLSKKGGRYGKK